MTLDEVNAEIAKLTADIANIDAEEKEVKGKGKSLPGRKVKARQKAQDKLKTFNLMKRNMERSTVEAEKPAEKPTTKTKIPTKTNASTGNTAAGKRLENTEKKAQDAADEMNSEELQSKKKEDAASAAETARDRAAQIDANIQENVPTWFWKEAQEMSPNDKAKRGFIITNHILNRLGTATGNIGAIVQNAGGSGGASLKEHGGSYIDQYRQGKIEQAMANRKSRQNNLLQQQIDALVAIGASENEARAIQSKLRNSAHWNKYNRLTNEQQVYIQGLLYSDTQGKISDAVLGNFIDQLMEGKNVSLEQAAVNALTAAGIDNVDSIKSGATGIKDKVVEWLNWKKPGM